MRRSRWRGSDEEEERARARRPEAARESPREVNTRTKKTSTAAKKEAETRSRRVHCRPGPPRLDGGRFTCPMPSPLPGSHQERSLIPSRDGENVVGASERARGGWGFEI